jgi:outer membrane protein assembly factor BamB
MLALLASAFPAAAVPAARAASGDWPGYLFGTGESGFNGAETIINQTTAPTMTLHWKYHLGKSINSQPIEANGMVYYGAWDGYEHASSLTGTRIWKTFLGTAINPCTNGIAGVVSSSSVDTVLINGTLTPVVFVGGLAQVSALNANSGAIIWQTPLSTSADAFIWSSPTLYLGSIFIGLASRGDCPTVPGQIFKLDEATGTIQGSFNVTPPGCDGGGVWGSLTIDTASGMLYFGTGNAGNCTPPEQDADAVMEVRASDMSFVGAWQAVEQPPNPGNTDNGPDFGSAPTLFTATIAGVQRALVGIIFEKGIFYVFDRTNISAGPVWSVKIATGSLGSISPGAWDGSQLYVGGGRTTINGVACQGSLRSLLPSTGAVVWQVCLTSGPVIGAVSVVPGLAVIGAGPDLDVIATTGAQAGQILFTYLDTSKSARFKAAPSISNGVIYIGGSTGSLFAVGP